MASRRRRWLIGERVATRSPRRRAGGLLSATLLLLPACQERSHNAARQEEPRDTSRACEALFSYVERAVACDPALARLAADPALRRDEGRCAVQIERILDDAQRPGTVGSLYDDASRGAGEGRGEMDHARLEHQPLPAWIELTPDLAPRPGRPTTEVRVNTERLASDARGLVRRRVSPGAHTLSLRYAGTRAEYCVRVDACDRVALTSHGASLAAHAAVAPGACPSAPAPSSAP